MTGSRRVWALLLAALAVGALSVAPSPAGPALAGDAKVAETLFKSGKQAHQKGDWSGAVTFFQKAQEEDPDLIEAVWWRASAQEKSGDKSAALASYREFQTLFEGKFSAGQTSKEEQRLKKLADKSVDTLAAGEKEYAKLEDAYVASLMKFAKDNFVRDPGVTLKALGMLLTVRPDHEEALKLQEKLGGAPAGGEAKGAPVAGPFKDVKDWKDLIAAKSFKSSKIEYTSGSMVLDTRDGSVLKPSEFLDGGTAFAYEFEFHVAEVYDRGWLTGLTFAAKDGAFVSAFAESGRVVLLLSKSQESQDEAAVYDMSPMDLAAWHRLGVIVRGPSVAVWFDGKQVATWKNPSGEDMPGELGIFQQRCRTERRVFRLGRLD